MKQKKLIIFMPSIEGGGVEKNLFIISNFLGTKLKNTSLITASRSYNSKFKGLKIINPKINTEKYSSRRLKYFFCLIELIKILSLNRNYVLLAFQANLYCAIICKIFKINIIVRSNSSPSGWALNYFRKKIFNLLLKIPNKIIVNSKEFQKEYNEKFKIKTHCIYNPLNVEFIKKKSKEKIKNNFFRNYKYLKIIFIGRLVDQKDPQTFVKALKLINNKIKFRAIIIGKGIYFSEIQKYVTDNKMKNKVKFLGWQNNPFKYLSSSDLLILTSKYEGLPNVLLEAVSLKKFIISSNCKTGPKEILDDGKGGELFKVGNYIQLSNKIITYNKNKKKYEKKINFSYKRLYRFDYNNNLKMYLELIKEQIYS